jgi:hypothetical protein
MLAQGDFDFHARIGIRPQHFDNASDRLCVVAWLGDDLRHDDLSCRRTAVGTRRDEERLMEALVLGLDQQDAMFASKATDDILVCAFHDLYDPDFASPSTIDADFTRDDAIAVQYLLHLAGTDEAIGLLVVADEKAEPVSMPLYSPAYEVHLVDETQRSASVAYQVAAALEPIDDPDEFGIVAVRKFQAARQFEGGHRYAARSHDGKHFLRIETSSLERLCPGAFPRSSCLASSIH